MADAGDAFDIHAVAMLLAAGASAVHPREALAAAREQAGSRGHETLEPDAAEAHLIGALDSALRKVLARMGISTLAAYRGGHLFEVLGLSDEVARRCFPAAPAFAGDAGFERLAADLLARHATAYGSERAPALHDPGFARFRSEGELHVFAPVAVKAIQALAGPDGGDAGRAAAGLSSRDRPRPAGPRPRLAPDRAGGRAGCPRPGRAGQRDHGPLRLLGDEPGRPVARGPPHDRDRDAPPGGGLEHRRGRRGRGLVHARRERRAGRVGDQAGRLGPLRGHRPLPRPGRAARDQDRPGLEARRGRPAAGGQGDRVHRRPPSRPAGRHDDQPAAPSRHLLDRGPGPADHRPAGDQSGRPDRGQAGRGERRRARSPRGWPRPTRTTS